MLVQGGAGRPVGVAAVCPRLGAPAGVEEGDGVRHVRGAEHVAQHGEGLGLGFGVGLGFDAGALVLQDGGEDDAGPGQEAGSVEGLPDGVVAAFGRVGVEEELGRPVPEDAVRWELQEDFGVAAHREGCDAFLFPGGKGRVECDDFVLKYAQP